MSTTCSLLAYRIEMDSGYRIRTRLAKIRSLRSLIFALQSPRVSDIQSNKFCCDSSFEHSAKNPVQSLDAHLKSFR